MSLLRITCITLAVGDVYRCQQYDGQCQSVAGHCSGCTADVVWWWVITSLRWGGWTMKQDRWLQRCVYTSIKVCKSTASYSK